MDISISAFNGRNRTKKETHEHSSSFPSYNANLYKMWYRNRTAAIKAYKTDSDENPCTN